MDTAAHVIRKTITDCKLIAAVFMSFDGSKIGSSEGADSEKVLADFNYYLASHTGYMRVEAWRQNDAPEKGGPISKRREAFKWVVKGEALGAVPSSSDAPYREPSPSPGPAMDVDAKIRLAVAEIELRYMTRERDALLNVDDPEDDPAPPMAPQPTLAEQVAQVAPHVKDLLLLLGLGRPVGGSAPMTGVPGAVSKDAELLRALDAYAQADPAGFVKQRELVLSMYSNGGVPPNGSDAPKAE